MSGDLRDHLTLLPGSKRSPLRPPAAVNNFLVIWSLCRARSDVLSRMSLKKAASDLDLAHQAIRSQHLQDNPEMLTQYAAVSDFLMTWTVPGSLLDWRPTRPCWNNPASASRKPSKCLKILPCSFRRQTSPWPSSGPHPCPILILWTHLLLLRPRKLTSVALPTNTWTQKTKSARCTDLLPAVLRPGAWSSSTSTPPQSSTPVANPSLLCAISFAPSDPARSPRLKCISPSPTS